MLQAAWESLKLVGPLSRVSGSQVLVDDNPSKAPDDAGSRPKLRVVCCPGRPRLERNARSFRFIINKTQLAAVVENQRIPCSSRSEDGSSLDCQCRHISSALGQQCEE